MAIFSRTKRVTDPLDDDAKARIFHPVNINHQDSPQLCELVHGFLEDAPEDAPEDGLQSSESDADVSENPTTEYFGKDNEEIVKMAVSFSDYDPYRNLLLSHVLRAVELYSGLKSKPKSVFRDKVASFLRELGHDAAVCASRWSSSSNLTAGSYDFIDVVYKPVDDQMAVRYFVDIDFASEFQIARPTRLYSHVLQLLPRIFVGKQENLRTIVRESCKAARLSLKSRGLSLPPWRRSSYLQQKWFGPYERRVIGSSFGVMPLNSDAVSCRFMGFDDAVNNRLFIKT